jgi:hypothetical protein
MIRYAFKVSDLASKIQQQPPTLKMEDIIRLVDTRMFELGIIIEMMQHSDITVFVLKVD